ncbi:putative plasma membrane ATP-binding cassette transporter [Limtongia smithiae]|uniref:putative plasma membrane ATP-binding cassette transporter n=1 Tax=Limtongia smithiae TaxID=1125753 RepID=UPI0034CD174D
MASADNTPASSDSTVAADDNPDLEAASGLSPTVSLAETVSAVASSDNLARLENLSRTLSHKNANDARDTLNEDEFSLENTLQQIIQKLDDQGIRRRSTGIFFKSLTAVGVDQAASFAPSMGEVFRSTLFFFQRIRAGRHIPVRNIIEDFNGLVRKGELLLVLGRPGAGCSTLLKCIAGQTDQLNRVTGTVSYGGLDQKTVKHYFKGDIIYNGELDVHFPSLSVDQTLSFAVECRTPRERPDKVSRREFVNNIRDILATVFGLTHAYKTKVGNDYVRGVSGGERKRVSIAEVLAARPAIVSWDNATRGLDASTALEYTQAIRTAANLTQNVALVAIYQAGEHIYKLFDKVTVIYAGQQVYFGPVSKAKDYFERMGYQCPARQTTPEFLTAVTDPAGRFPKPGMESKVPKTAVQFATYWKQSPEYQALLDDIESYESAVNADETMTEFRLSAQQEKMKGMPKSSPFTIAYRSQIALCVKRGVQRIIGDKAYMITHASATVIQSLIIGSLFWNIEEDGPGAFSRGGVLFFAILYNALTCMAEITASYAQRPIVLKQKYYSFYHPSAEALSSMLADLPIKLATIIVFDIILYFLANLKRTAGQFFYFVLFTVMVTYVMRNIFQTIAAMTKTIEVANAIAGLMLLSISIYAGYVIPRPSMHPWFKWISYINPVAYGFENLMVNEFHNRIMPCGDYLIPRGSTVYEELPVEYKVCAMSGAKTGQDYVLGDDYLSASYQYEWHHLWRNFGIMIGFWIFFSVTYALATEYLRPVSGGGDVLLFKRNEQSAKMVQSATSALRRVGTLDEKRSSILGDENDDNNAEALQKLDESVKSSEVFSWQHVNYTIPVSGGTRKLLDDVQGYVKPGTMTALIGESGAGKTTLLNVLAQRVDFGVITGDMLVNGKPLDISFQRRTGYVQQQDLHVAESSVREALRFSAVLRQPNSVSLKEKYAYVENVIRLLDMEDYSEAIIGEPGRGLNVEQRKKLSIGVELAAKPNLLLFLDEPTSGLDSQSAWAIVTFLRKLADAGQSILCTIHQPSATLFEQFDRLLLLKKGGQTVYFGDIGKNSQTILDYFKRQGAPPCGADDNPAEYILDCIGAGATATVKSDWYELWADSEDCRKVTEEITNLQDELKALPENSLITELRSRYAASWLMQLREVTLRVAIHYWRSPSYIIAKFALSILAGLFVGFTFWNLDHSIAGVQNGLFATFMVLITSVAFINQMQPRLINLRELFEVRENASNTYHWSVMLLAQILVELPYNFLSGAIYFQCFYWPGNYFRRASRAGYFYLMYGILYQLFITSFGLGLGGVSPDSASASIISALLFSFVLAFCGVLQPSSMMPGFWVFMYRVSPLTYLIQSLLGAIFHGMEVTCTEDEYNVFNPPPGYTCDTYTGVFAEEAGGYIANLNATSGCKFCKWSVADTFLETIGVHYSTSHWRNVGLLCAYIAFNFWFMFAGYYFFRVRKWRTPWILRLVFKFFRGAGRFFSGGAQLEDMSKLQRPGKLAQEWRDDAKKMLHKIRRDAGVKDEEVEGVNAE